jgi:hypothetical protein
MSNTAPPNLGNIIASPGARKVIYGTYALAAIVVGGVAAYFLGIGDPLPEVVVGAQAVVAYLGIPVGGLALANTPPAPAGT